MATSPAGAGKRAAPAKEPPKRVRRKPHPHTPHATELPGCEGLVVNLMGDYEYLSEGFYLSQELEAQGPVHPTCREALDAYVVPVLLEKAKLAGVAVPDYYLTNEYFDPPVVVDAVNPFMTRHQVVRSAWAQEKAALSLTRNYTYPICCQVIPKDYRLGHFNAVLGWAAQPRYRALAAEVWALLRIPLARVRVLASPDRSKQVLLSGIGPLPPRELSEREHAHLREAL